MRRRRLFVPVNSLRRYFGEQVAYYTAWMNFYTWCLLIPGIAGGSLFAYNTALGYTVEDSPYIAYFSFFMVLWSVTFLKMWRRKASELACQWDTFDIAKREVVRPGFKGTLRKNPVTGHEELHYPKSMRFLKYSVSVVVSTILLVPAVAAMAFSLNLQGYVHSESSLFYIHSLSQYAQPGALFDPNSQVMCFVPVVLHVITIQLLNRIYRVIAENLTAWENHKTEQSHESSLILKRVCFEAFDCYIAIFYLAFVERDIFRVRKELSSLYTVDCLRRVGTELLLPLILQFFTNRASRQALEKLKRESGERAVHEQAVRDARLDAYEEFDDFVEMVIAFGYVTMFASAFPLAAFIQILYNLIEMKSDVYKLCFVVQRPPVVRANGIGSWQVVLQIQAWLSLITNILMFVLSSDHMKNWCASMSTPQVGCFCIGVLVLEHVLGAIMFLILEVCPDVPESVQLKIERQKYMEEKEASGGRRT